MFLIDNSNSMILYDYFVCEFLEWERQAKRLYFRNCIDRLPGGRRLQTTPKGSDYVDIVDVNWKANPRVTIISDAGAARRGYNSDRVEATKWFLEWLSPHPIEIDWFNPVEQQYWKGTSAEDINDILHGHGKMRELPKGFIDLNKVDWNHSPVDGIPDPIELEQYRRTQRRYTRFILDDCFVLATYAAIVPNFSPELLYALREKFTPSLPYQAIPDIIYYGASSVGDRLFEFDNEFRLFLLKAGGIEDKTRDTYHEVAEFCNSLVLSPSASSL
jgi:hypothetical protein